MMGDYDDRGWMMGRSAGWGGWLIVAVLLVLTIGALLVWLLRPTGATGSARVEPPEPGRARALLDQRFASGAIDADDYRTRVQVLRGG
jgi:putative membrane protein